MQYDPIKKVLGHLFNKTPFLRVIFYKLLDILLLRTWHVKKEIRIWGKSHKGRQKSLMPVQVSGSIHFICQERIKTGRLKQWM